MKMQAVAAEVTWKLANETTPSVENTSQDALLATNRLLSFLIEENQMLRFTVHCNNMEIESLKELLPAKDSQPEKPDTA